MEYVFLVSGIVLVTFYTYNYRRAFFSTNLVFKILSSLCFLLVALSLAIKRSFSETYIIWLLLGLFFGFIGDIVLGLKELYPQKRNKIIFLGISFFLLGHLFYYLAFLSFQEFIIIWPLLITTILTITLIICNKYLFKLVFSDNKTKYLAYFYTFVINNLLVLSFFNLLKNYNNLKGVIFFAVLMFDSDCDFRHAYDRTESAIG